jgi:cell division protein FtsQ
MKIMVKKVLLMTVAAVCCVTVLVGGVWCSTRCNSSPCTEVSIVVKDSLKRHFVDATEIEGYLKSKGCYPLGDSMRLVDCHSIEQCLLNHDMVRKAECYQSPFGKVSIMIYQRIPVMGVVSNDGCYYVDSERRVMPVRGEMDNALLILRGAVSERAAREEYYDFVEWLSADEYWSTRIRDIYVHNPKNLVLRQKELKAKIILGELDGYAGKMEKLRVLYTQGLDEIGYPDYSEYDLRFDKQVVGRK